MARKKKPEQETLIEEVERKILEAVANAPTRSDKISWNRKMDNMVKLLAKLRPIEEKIVELQAKKIPIFDEIQQLRLVMIKECIHPSEYLVVKENYVLCKFCNKKVNLTKEISI